MRKIAGVGHVSNRFVDYDAVTNPTGTVITADFMNDVQDELIGIQDEFSIAEAAGTSEYILSAIKGIAIKYGRRVGEYFTLDQYKAPAEFDKDDPDSFFPAICLDTIDGKTDISSTNYSDLVTHLRAKTFKYFEGISGSEKSAFDVTGWAIASNVATLTFANTTAENAILAALAEDNLVNGDYTDWRSITLATAIGDITAGEYAITDVDAAARTISFAFTAANNSGTGTYTVNFYQHRIPGSTTTARLYEVKGRSVVSANDADGENIAGLLRRDRMQGHKFTVGDSAIAGSFVAYQRATGGAAFAKTSNVIDEFPVSDGTNGTPRTGTTTDPRSLVGHLYMWAGSYTA